MLKKILLSLLILLSISQLMNAETISTRYDLLRQETANDFQDKYGRTFNPKLTFFPETVSGNTFQGNLDAEVLFSAMKLDLQKIKLSEEKPVWYEQLFFSRESYFVYGVIFTIVMYDTLGNTIIVR